MESYFEYMERILCLEGNLARGPQIVIIFVPSFNLLNFFIIFEIISSSVNQNKITVASEISASSIFCKSNFASIFFH